MEIRLWLKPGSRMEREAEQDQRGTGGISNRRDTDTGLCYVRCDDCTCQDYTDEQLAAVSHVTIHDQQMLLLRDAGEYKWRTACAIVERFVYRDDNESSVSAYGYIAKVRCEKLADGLELIRRLRRGKIKPHRRWPHQLPETSDPNEADSGAKRRIFLAPVP